MLSSLFAQQQWRFVAAFLVGSGLTWGCLSFAWADSPVRVRVRWATDVTSEQRTELESRLQLTDPRHDGGTTWIYWLPDASTVNIRTIVEEQLVADTHHVDRTSFRPEFAQDRSLHIPLYSLAIGILCVFVLELGRTSIVKRTGTAIIGNLVVRKLLTLALPSMLLTLTLALAVSEAWIRATWDPRRGTPGFYLADPVLVERLAPSYDGWFAGIPVHTNNLGFRDPRDYALEKDSRTFRILILGDSVTFGHGSIYEHTYPYLLEQQLNEWRPEVNWQVWNTGVPGWSTSSELGYLMEVGPSFKPDLVIVGFYWNDVYEQISFAQPGMARRLEFGIHGAMKRHLYSYGLFRKAYHTLGMKLSNDPSSSRLLEVIAVQESQLAVTDDLTALKAQELTYPEEIANAPPSICSGSLRSPFEPGGEIDHVAATQSRPTYPEWLAAVRRFQDLAQSGTYRLIFFVNMAPDVCLEDDRFYDGTFHAFNNFFAQVFSAQGTPVVSSYEGFKNYRPSQMPSANGHSLGNSNWVKASVLFDFLRDYLPDETPSARDAVGRGE